MQRSTFVPATRRLALAAGVVAASLAATACSDDTSGGTGPDTPRMYNQIQRLGNPLVSEVLLSKRSHPTHGSIGPDQDASLVAPEVVDFLTTVAGRDPAYISAIAPALIPDVLVVDTSKDPSASAVGWLTWLPQLGGGYGGRRLTDDVVDLALTAVFGDALGDAGNATPELTTDYVANDSPNITSTFPYLAPPN